MAQERDISILTFGDSGEQARRRKFVELLRECPIPDDELALNIGLFLTPQTLSRVLFMDFLYRQIIPVQGVIIEFGCRWGQNLSLFSSLRGIYEPFNRFRRIVGFDTFEGLTGVSPLDGERMKAGAYCVSPEYDAFLRRLLDLQEEESPLSHLKRYEVIRGDAATSIREYLDRHPETVIALAYFDMDIYEPTVQCLRAIQERLTRGSILGFDEVNEPACPGETLALNDVLGLRNVALRRFQYNSRASYLTIE
jgi:hypothetical protein